MRRLLTFAAFLVIFSIIPVCAQRGGHVGGGGFSGGHGGFGGGGHVAGGGHSFGGGFSGSHAGPIGGSHFTGSRMGSFAGVRNGFGSRGFRGDHFRGTRFGYGFRSRCYGCWGYGYYGYPYWGYYDPYWWWNSGSSYDDDEAQERQLANEMNEQNLEEQQRLRQQDQDAYAQPMSRPRDVQPTKQEPAQTESATLLVFRNGSQREIHNYAIVDGMLFNFTASRTEKIPLAILDIPATVKANDDRGVDFHLPGTGEGF